MQQFEIIEYKNGGVTMNGAATLITNDFDYLNLLSENNELTDLFISKADSVRDSLANELNLLILSGGCIDSPADITKRLLMLKAMILKQMIFLQKHKINMQLDDINYIDNDNR